MNKIDIRLEMTPRLSPLWTLGVVVVGACAATLRGKFGEPPPPESAGQEPPNDLYPASPSTRATLDDPSFIHKQSTTPLLLSDSQWQTLLQSPSIAKMATALQSRGLSFRPRQSVIDVNSFKAIGSGFSVDYFLAFDQDDQLANGAWYLYADLYYPKEGKIRFSEGLLFVSSHQSGGEKTDLKPFEPTANEPATLFDYALSLFKREGRKGGLPPARIVRFDPERFAERGRFLERVNGRFPPPSDPLGRIALELDSWRAFIDAEAEAQSTLIADLFDGINPALAYVLMRELGDQDNDRAVDVFVKLKTRVPFDALGDFAADAAPRDGFPDVPALLRKVGEKDPDLESKLVEHLRWSDSHVFWAYGGFRYANVIETRGEFEVTVLHAKGVDVVDFGADWCSPRSIMAPHFDAVAFEFKKKQSPVRFHSYPIDLENHSEGWDDFTTETMRRYKIGPGLPKIHLYRDGKLVAELDGKRSRVEIYDFVMQNL